jgi:hypothetical protein
MNKQLIPKGWVSSSKSGHFNVYQLTDDGLHVAAHLHELVAAAEEEAAACAAGGGGAGAGGVVVRRSLLRIHSSARTLPPPHATCFRMASALQLCASS